MTEPTLYLLDTNIISDMMRNPQGRANLQLEVRIAQSKSPLRVCTSVVVDCEVRYGLRRTSSSKLDRAYTHLLQVVEVLPLDALVTPHYASLRARLEQAGKSIGANDSLIAAHALALGATLITADAEFSRVPDLALENWLVETT
jgi:tRNA(fMet)-specific endonuclease VapC